MSDLESAFEKLLGRQPSEREVESLYRVKNALGIRDNDSLWMVLMALESYDTLYKKYPSMISNQVDNVLSEFRLTASAVADAESKKALSTLANAVSNISDNIAKKTVDTQRLLAMGFFMFCMITFGALCTFVGYVLGSGNMPFWAKYDSSSSPVIIILTAIAQTPAGLIASLAGGITSTAIIFRLRNNLRSSGSKATIVASIFLLGLSAALLAPFLY